MQRWPGPRWFQLLVRLNMQHSCGAGGVGGRATRFQAHLGPESCCSDDQGGASYATTAGELADAHSCPSSGVSAWFKLGSCVLAP